MIIVGLVWFHTSSFGVSPFSSKNPTNVIPFFWGFNPHQSPIFACEISISWWSPILHFYGILWADSADIYCEIRHWLVESNMIFLRKIEAPVWFMFSCHLPIEWLVFIGGTREPSISQYEKDIYGWILFLHLSPTIHEKKGRPSQGTHATCHAAMAFLPRHCPHVELKAFWKYGVYLSWQDFTNLNGDIMEYHQRMCIYIYCILLPYETCLLFHIIYYITQRIFASASWIDMTWMAMTTRIETKKVTTWDPPWSKPWDP